MDEIVEYALKLSGLQFLALASPPSGAFYILKRQSNLEKQANMRTRSSKSVNRSRILAGPKNTSSAVFHTLNFDF